MAEAANPTLATVAKVQRVLKNAEGPVSRYQLHKRLRGTVNYPVLDAILGYFAELRVVYDEGAGGKVLWIHNPKAGDLFASSRRVDRVDLRQLVKKRRKDILRIARIHGASNIRLFGSVARGDPDAQDIDLLVDYGPKVSLLDAIALQNALRDLLRYPVDVVQQAALSPYIRERVLKEAVAL